MVAQVEIIFFNWFGRSKTNIYINLRKNIYFLKYNFTIIKN